MITNRKCVLYYKSADIWDSFSNPLDAKLPCEGTECNGSFITFEPFKLHITINSADNLKVITQIKSLLITSILDGVIRSFKVLDRDTAIKLEEHDLRAHHTPYSIYLHHSFSLENANAVTALCNKISNILAIAAIQPSSDYYLVPNIDLRLSRYFSFRCTATRLSEPYQYISASSPDAVKAAEFGRKSPHYQYLIKQLNPNSTKTQDSKLAPLSFHNKKVCRIKFSDEDFIEREEDHKKFSIKK